MTTLTSQAATAAGWHLERTPTGRTRVVDPEGRRYIPAAPERAEVVITCRIAGVRPFYLKRATPPLRLRDVQLGMRDILVSASR